MTRFDIVVANRNKAEIFWQGFFTINNFDPLLDRIVFMDCSDNYMDELSKCMYYIKKYELMNINFLFLKRRNWIMNQGAMLDYVRLLGEGILEYPMYAFFMQDHYINKQALVKGDTIPDDVTLDLDNIYDILSVNNDKLVVTATRYGFRICASVPEEYCGDDYGLYDDRTDYKWCWVSGKLGSVINGKYCCDHFIYYNASHLKGSQDICIAVDGSNFCVNPKYYVSHYKSNKKLYSGGLGDYTDALIWETRLSKILYDQGLGFYDLTRNVCFQNTEELKKAQPDPDSTKLWCYFYNSPLFYWILGRDIWHYDFKLTDAYFRYAQYCINQRKLANTDTTLRLLYDSRESVENFKGEYPKNSVLFIDARDIRFKSLIKSDKMMAFLIKINSMSLNIKESQSVKMAHKIKNIPRRGIRYAGKILKKISGVVG